MSFVTFASMLKECCLAFKGGKSVLETLNLSLAASFAFFVGLRLSNAPFLELCIIFQNGCELRVGSVSVSRELRDLLVQGGGLLSFVFCILPLGCSGNFVLLGYLLVL